MNWLLYVGGYSVFSSLCQILDAIAFSLLSPDKKILRQSYPIVSSFGIWLDSLSHLLVWIWICWRFIA